MKLIDKLLDNAKDVVEAAKKPFIKKKLTRAFESALDSAEEKKVNSELRIQDLREKLIKEPERANDILNSIVEERTTIKRADLTIDAIKKEKTEWFSEVK